MGKEDNEFQLGWRILLGCFLGIGFGLSSVYFYSIGVFIKPLTAEFGWTRGEVSLGSMFGTIASVIGSITVGRLVDKYSAVLVGLCSLLALSAGFFLLSTMMSGLVSYLILVTLISFFAIGSTGLAFTRPIIENFEKHRGLALGLVLSGAGTGAIIVPRLLTPFVAENGWRDGYFILGAIVLVMTPIVWLTFNGRNVPKAPKIEKTGSDYPVIFSQTAFYAIGGIFLLASISIIGTVVHFVPLLTDQGLTPVEAGATASLIGFAAIAGRLIAGFLIDRFPAGIVTCCLFLLAACGLVTLALGGDRFLVLGALVAGLAIGAEIDLLTYLTGKYFPQRMFGQAYGLLFALFSVGAAIGPVLYGYMFDVYGDYVSAMLIGAGLLALSAVISLLLDRLTPQLT